MESWLVDARCKDHRRVSRGYCYHRELCDRRHFPTKSEGTWIGRASSSPYKTINSLLDPICRIWTSMQLHRRLSRRLRTIHGIYHTQFCSHRRPFGCLAIISGSTRELYLMKTAATARSSTQQEPSASQQFMSSKCLPWSKKAAGSWRDCCVLGFPSYWWCLLLDFGPKMRHRQREMGRSITWWLFTDYDVPASFSPRSIKWLLLLLWSTPTSQISPTPQDKNESAPPSLLRPIHEETSEAPLLRQCQSPSQRRSLRMLSALPKQPTTTSAPTTSMPWPRPPRITQTRPMRTTLLTLPPPLSTCIPPFMFHHQPRKLLRLPHRDQRCNTTMRTPITTPLPFNSQMGFHPWPLRHLSHRPTVYNLSHLNGVDISLPHPSPLLVVKSGTRWGRTTTKKVGCSAPTNRGQNTLLTIQ